MPGKLIDLLSDTLELLFVPSDDFFSEKISYFRSKFTFVDSVVDCVELIQDAFEDSSSFGNLTVDLSSSESSYNYGSGQINILNVSWYSKYKPLGDKLLSAIMWLLFVFNVFKQLPGIINGVSGAAVAAEGISSEVQKRGV